MDTGITRIFLEILGISVCWGQILILHVHLPFFACVWAWGVKQSYFRDVTENQGGRSASRLVVGVWREGVILNRI